MAHSKDADSRLYSFSLEVLDRRLNDHEVERLLQEVTDETLQELAIEPGAIETELEGGFAGIGEIAVVLLIKKASVIFASAALTGFGKKAGEHLFQHYLAPKLRARNLSPTNLQEVEEVSGS